MKRFALVFLSLVMVLGSFAAMPIASAEGETVIVSGHSFVDIAHNGNTYVALSKPTSDWATAQIYLSTDGGLTWRMPRGIITSALVSSNKPSQQQLVYWKEGGVFVIHCGETTFTSPTGETWTAHKSIWASANEVITTSGNQLISSQANIIAATSIIAAGNENCMNTFNTNPSSYPIAVAAKPADANGNISILMNNQNKLWEVRLNTSSGSYEWSLVDKNDNNGNIPSAPYDMVYNNKSDRFMSVDGSENLFIAQDSQNFIKVKIAEGVKITGVGVSDKYVIVGTDTGKLYCAANKADGITAETSWTEIPAQGTPSAEPIKNIEFSDDGESYLALGTTQIFKGTSFSYTNINEYKGLGKPYITGGRDTTFDGIRLIGGTYANIDGQDTYIVYGDTAASMDDATTLDGKTPANCTAAENRAGKIFTSTDGINWRETKSGPTFSWARKNSTEEAIVYTDVKNGAVYWEAQKQFIISASTQAHSGVSLVSSDGVTWTQKTYDDTGLRLNVDLAAVGDTLYMAHNGRAIHTFTAFADANRTMINLGGASGIPAQLYANQMAVSNEANPAILLTVGYQGLIRDKKSTETEEAKKWKYRSNLSSNGTITDAVYSDKLEKFVAVSGSGHLTSVIAADNSLANAAAIVQGPAAPNNVVCNAIDTDGSDFMFAGADGKIYTAPDKADFSRANTTLTAVPAADGAAENKMNVTNVFKAGENTFIATASDNRNSAVLLIKKNGSGWSYTSTADSAKLDGLEAGAEISVNVDGVNTTDTAYTFAVVAAVYSNGILVQAEPSVQTIAANSNKTVALPMTLIENLPNNSEIRVYLWNNLTDMSPLRQFESNPF